MKMRFSSIFKLANVVKLTKVILEISHKNLDFSKWKTLKRLVYFLRAVELWATFDIQIELTLANELTLEMLQKLHFLKNSQQSP